MRRKLAYSLITETGLSQRQACDLVSLSRSQYNYQSQKKEDPKVIKEIIKIKERYPSYGVPRVLATLRRQGLIVNGKRVYRLMKSLRLQAIVKPKRKHFFRVRNQDAPIASKIGSVWSMDFVLDKLADGTAFRCLTIVDNLSREVPGIYVSKSMSGFSPVDYLESLKHKAVLPEWFILDNGPEFANHVLAGWCKRNDVKIHFIDPGQPVQNAYIESFNGKFREEFLNPNKFTSLGHVRSKLRTWINYYNTERPHSSLDYMTPKEFADNMKAVLAKNNNLLVLKTG